MIQFDPRALYRLDEVRDMLKGYISMDTFLSRTGLRRSRAFRDCLTGAEIIKALEAAEPFNVDAGAGAVVDMTMRAGGKARGGRGSGPVRKLRADEVRDD